MIDYVDRPFKHTIEPNWYLRENHEFRMRAAEVKSEGITTESQ